MKRRFRRGTIIVLLICAPVLAMMFSGAPVYAAISYTTVELGDNAAWALAPGTEVWITGDFMNSSTNREGWNTGQASLKFMADLFPDPPAVTQYTHIFQLTGTNKGQVPEGYVKNFAWGTLSIEAENSIVLGVHPNRTGLNAALYVGRLEGLHFAVTTPNTVDNIIGNGYTIYYDGKLNPELQGKTFSLAQGGFIMPSAAVPLPPALLLFAPGLAALAALRERLRK